MKDAVTKSWFAVLNNPAEHGYAGTPEEVCSRLRDEWLMGGTERTGAWAYCVSADGLPHIHMVLEDAKAMRFSAVKTSYAVGTHFEATKGNKKQAEAYIEKQAPFDEKGEQIIQRSLESMNEVHAASVELRESMAQLNDHAQSINQIMIVISDMGYQPTLLALTAAIVAARAGVAGRGFAVVADEVRKLAEKTMASTHDVGNAIRSIQESTAKSAASVDSTVRSLEETSQLSHESEQALESIVANTETSADQVRAIAAASEEQSVASEQIDRSIQEINSISGQTSEAMSEAARAVEGLADQVRHLEALIAEMKSA